MSPAEIIERATEEGVLLALSSTGSISAKGEQSAIDRWLPAIKQSKTAIIAELQLERRRAKVLAMLRDNPGIRYAIEVVDANADPVIVSIGIRNVATFEMNIPQAYYDAFALLEVIDALRHGDVFDMGDGRDRHPLVLRVTGCGVGPSRIAGVAWHVLVAVGQQHDPRGRW